MSRPHSAPGQPRAEEGHAVSAAPSELLGVKRPLGRLLTEVERAAQLGSWERDIATGVTTWTPQMYDIYGTVRGDGHPERHRSLLHPADADALEEMFGRVMNGGAPEEVETRLLRHDGAVRILQTRAQRIVSIDGDKLVGTTQDITARRELERTVSATRDHLVGILDAATETLIIVTDETGTVTGFNRGAERMLGYRTQEVVGRVTPEVFHDPAEVAARGRELGIPTGFEVFVHAARRGEAERREWTFLRRDGSRLMVSLTITAISATDGVILGFVGVGVDISDARAAEFAQARAEHRFQAAFAHAPIGMALVDLRAPGRGRLMAVNPALAQLLGRAPDDLEGTLLAELMPDGAGAPGSTADLLYAGDPSSTASVERPMLTAGGEEIWTAVSCTPVPAEDGGDSEYAVAQIVDISERRRFERQLRHLADHDPLTGLLNRHGFGQALERVVAESRRYGRRGALLVLDLDGFKGVNDSFGHAMGDELVSRVGSLLRATVRSSDTVARLGGDEFAILLQETGETEAIAVAENVLETIRRRGVVAQDVRQARVTTSVGITAWDRRYRAGSEELIVEADTAMYEAKAAGRNRWAVFDRQSNRRASGSPSGNWLVRLREALEEDLFELHAQPISPICGGSGPQFELLLRLPDADGRQIPPNAFLPTAERFDLVGDVDRWVLAQAVKLLHEHSRAGHDLSLAVNLSGRSMNDLSLSADLASMLSAEPFPAGRLIIEVTETAAIVNLDRARELAAELRALGCRFALDDFGAGFASFLYLKHLEFDLLKIDGEFIKGLTRTPTDQLVVRAVVDIAAGLGTDTVAEFVGDAATVDMLHSLGVGFGQGYFLGRPAPLAERLPFLEPAAWLGAHDGESHLDGR